MRGSSIRAAPVLGTVSLNSETLLLHAAGHYVVRWAGVPLAATEGCYLTHRAKQPVIALAPTEKADEVDGILASIEKLVSFFEEALLREFACAMSYAYSIGVQCPKGRISFVSSFKFEL